ncbi:MAG: hypothetical protein AAB355_01535 [Patescibacteria group bacterium]
MSMKKVVVSRKVSSPAPNRFDACELAKGLIFASGFSHGQVAYVKYRSGKLTIHLGKKVKEE